MDSTNESYCPTLCKDVDTYANTKDLSQVVLKGCLYEQIRQLGLKHHVKHRDILNSIDLGKNQFTTYVNAYKLYKKWPRFVSINCNITELQPYLVCMYSVVVQALGGFASNTEMNEDVDSHYQIPLSSLLTTDQLERLQRLIYVD